MSNSEIRVYLYRSTHSQVRSFAFDHGIDLKAAYQMIVGFILDQDGHLKESVRRDFLSKNQRLREEYGGRIY